MRRGRGTRPPVMNYELGERLFAVSLFRDVPAGEGSNTVVDIEAPFFQFFYRGHDDVCTAHESNDRSSARIVISCSSFFSSIPMFFLAFGPLFFYFLLRVAKDERSPFIRERDRGPGCTIPV